MRLYLLAALSLMLIGCASSGPKIDTPRLSEVRKGTTTIAEVVNGFGRPSILSKNMNGTQTAAYMHVKGRSDASGFVLLMSALVGNTDADLDSVIFYFDSQGVLRDYKTTQASERKPALASAETAAQAGTDIPAASRTSTPAQGNANEPARAAKKSAIDSNPWTIQLNPSGFRENR